MHGASFAFSAFMELFLIDAIGPFFRGYQKHRINWSKIPFDHIRTEGKEADAQWSGIFEESERFAKEVSELGYNAVTLDDLAHLTAHPKLEDDIRVRNEQLCERFKQLFAIHKRAGLDVYVTSDVICTTPQIDAHLGNDSDAVEAWYAETIDLFFTQCPEVCGLILRIGESDGLDVRDVIRSRLHLRTAKQTNRFLKRVLPVFEKHGKRLILRTWTVGAHRIGDLIWHKDRVGQVLRGIQSDAFVLSLKHGESDFFRYLPVNGAFFRTEVPKIIELQARREYEGAGEYPSFIGWECERMQRELKSAKNMLGFSVWCQTGGWHAFKRRPFRGDDKKEGLWVELNCRVALGIFQKEQTVDEIIHEWIGAERATAALELLRHSDTAIRELLYVKEYAQQKLFFRRVRLPPLLHVYWDCLFCTSSVRKLMRYFVSDHENALRSGEAVLPLFDRMKVLAEQAELPVDDIEFMQDTFEMIALARRYYFLPYDEAIVESIRASKKKYKARWPRSERQRYRIKTGFEPFRLKRRTLTWATLLLLRRQRGYRLLDHVFTLRLLSLFYRLFKNRTQKALPKFVRKSAMGIDSVLR